MYLLGFLMIHHNLNVSHGNSFRVELGKQLANVIVKELSSK